MESEAMGSHDLVLSTTIDTHDSNRRQERRLIPWMCR